MVIGRHALGVHETFGTIRSIFTTVVFHSTWNSMRFERSCMDNNPQIFVVIICRLYHISADYRTGTFLMLSPWRLKVKCGLF